MAVDVSSPAPVVERVMAELAKEPLEVIEDQDFADQDVYLDGRSFVRCSFERCRMLVAVGNFEVVEPRALSYCEFLLDGPAENIQSLVDYVMTEGEEGAEDDADE